MYRSVRNVQTIDDIQVTVEVKVTSIRSDIASLPLTQAVEWMFHNIILDAQWAELNIREVLTVTLSYEAHGITYTISVNVVSVSPSSSSASDRTTFRSSIERIISLALGILEEGNRTLESGKSS